MYRIFWFIIFLLCVYKLLIDPGVDALLTIIPIIAVVFQDNIYSVVGRKIILVNKKCKPVRNFDNSKFSFISKAFINPLIVNDLRPWLSDGGRQIISINVTDSNSSNRYYYDKINVIEHSSNFPVIECIYNNGAESFSYRYIGCSIFSGIHMLETSSRGIGSGVFKNIVFIVLTLEKNFGVGDDDNLQYKSELIIKEFGSISLGDRYDGYIRYKYGFLIVSKSRYKRYNDISKKGRWFFIV